MPSLISTTERANLTGIFNDIFDTFQRPITVYKEPIKVAQTIDSTEFVYGFGDEQVSQAYTYVERTGVYAATIRYPHSIDTNSFTNNKDVNIKIPEGWVSIKVKEDCRNYINDGKTDKIIVDAKTYYLDSDERKQAFLDSEFWVFVLKPTR